MPHRGKLEIRTHIVKVNANNATLNEYAAYAFPILGSKNASRKAIEEGRLKLNGQYTRPYDRVMPGDKLELEVSSSTSSSVFRFDIEIVYQDEHLIVVNKPGGIAVNGLRNKTVENALAGSVSPSPQEDALPTPIATHRLDVPTKGLIMLARTKSALININRAFQEKQIKKAYVAVVHGKLSGKGRVDRPLKDKNAITDYESLEVVPSKVFGHLSLIKLYPITGRTHQLRIHMQQLGHLVVGDKEYAQGQKTIFGKGLFLCSCFLGFDHPVTNERIELEIPIPKRFTRLIEREEKRF